MYQRFAVFLFSVLILLPNQLSAQGVFEAFGFPKTVIATGHTETIGSIHLALRLGTTVSETLVIDVSPFRITNTNVADIRLTTAGNITTGATTIEAADGRVRIPINAGANTGSLRVDGIRVSVAGSSASSITARLSWASRSNYFTGSDSVIVVNQVKAGMVVDPMTNLFRIYAGAVIDSTGEITMREGFDGAFSNSSDYGQDTATRIRVRVTDFPAGLTMQFPASVVSEETSATLTTVEGTSIMLPRAGGNTDVIYAFAGSAASATTVETFKIPFTVGTTGTVELLQPTIALSLDPIGTAEPTTTLSSTNVPRFAEENLVVLEGSSIIITKTLYWAGIDNGRTNNVSVFNPTSRNANITLSAIDAAGQLLSGTNIANPVKQSLGPNQSLNQTLAGIFGSSATNISTIRIQSTNPDVVALGTTSASGVSDSVSFLDRGIPDFDLPAVGDQARFYFFNPTPAAISGTLTLRAQNGSTVASTTLNIGSMATISRSLQDLFGTVAGTQVVGRFPNPMIAFGSFNSASTLDSVAAQIPIGQPSFFVPLFVSGAGYETELSLINRSEDTVTLAAQLVNSQGTPVGSPSSITLGPSQQRVIPGSQLFSMQGFTMGYVRIQVPQMARAFWSYYPPITGHARIRSGQSGSTVLPISAYPQSEASILNSGSPASHYQGIAVVNPTASSASVTLQAISSGGALLGTTTFDLGPGQLSSKMISEYFAVSVPEGSVIRVLSPVGVVTTSITGSLNGDSLRSTMGLR